MSKTLIIVESPAKAEKIQGYVGDDYIVLASKGHCTELASKGLHGIGVDVNNNFKPHYVISADKIDTLQMLMNAAKQCNLILMAPDSDAEGEMIAYQLSQRLEDTGLPIKRISFNEIKKAKILKAIQEPRDIDMNIVNAAQGRRVVDRLVGFMGSPFLMNYFGNKLSCGRVQSPLARMVVDRERQIEVFVPEKFFTIQAELSKDGKESFTAKYSGRPTDDKVAEAMKTKLADKTAEYIVSEVLSDKESKSALPPLITSTLQRMMSKDHGIGPEQTMKAAQSLYEQGHISYMRTDSVRCSDESIAEAREWISTNKFAIPKKPNVFKNKDNAQDAHEAIRPSDINLNPDNNFAIIDPDEKEVYRAIWKNFIASQMTPAIYSTLKITAHIKGDKTAEVKASGKALIDPGHLAIFGPIDNGKIEIPNLQVGDILNLFGKYPVKLEKKETQPPPRFSEDKLLKALEDKGIGRPSTYAELLSKVTSRNYVEKRGNVYHATDLGKKIIDELTKYFTFMNYDYTKKLEDQLDDIKSGKLSYLDVLKQFYPAFKAELNKAYLANGGCLCAKCDSPMATRTNKLNGKTFLSCTAYPVCKSSKSAEASKPILENSELLTIPA